ncbi:uncharacterized protein ASCRUDRAFT_70056 [Ascoidea rubescens DSM 1968]|uniref:Uncharacterized protein n=1 Tax=Ascoidea rubescens DSM 1968 TaxID=1344418 RepID=A0A1D2VIY3_9ASCO|nr:hypothetical protein ASCRUDRAFT_70056 [Ascoidea rubescens DSM 1968]ODV61579.1 hypothetical protein ASCRUDRAFT_70056 [Ascoidea rubescens DSM 1968]
MNKTNFVRKISFDTSTSIGPKTNSYYETNVAIHNCIKNNLLPGNFADFVAKNPQFLIPPSYNKPLFNTKFNHNLYCKNVENSKNILIGFDLIKLQNYEISLKCLNMIFNNFVDDYDNVFITIIINKFTLDKYGLINFDEINYWKEKLNKEFINQLLINNIFKNQPAKDKKISVSIDLIFDKNVKRALENNLMDYNPDILVLGINDKNFSSLNSITSKLFMKVSKHSASTSTYFLRSSKIPVIVVNSNFNLKNSIIPNKKVKFINNGQKLDLEFNGKLVSIPSNCTFGPSNIGPSCKQQNFTAKHPIISPLGTFVS